MTHDYKRNGTTTLFAALDVKTGAVIGECLPRHRAKEFIRFLKKIDRTVAKHLDLHLVVDNYTTHKTDQVKAWLERHPRFTLHFIPTSSSWLNLVERFSPRSPASVSGAALQESPRSWKPPSKTISTRTMPPQNAFVWTKTADIILEKNERARAVLECREVWGAKR